MTLLYVGLSLIGLILCFLYIEVTLLRRGRDDKEFRAIRQNRKVMKARKQNNPFKRR